MVQLFAVTFCEVYNLILYVYIKNDRRYLGDVVTLSECMSE